MFFQKYTFGNTVVIYAEAPVEGHENLTTVGFTAYPKEYEPGDVSKLRLNSLVQAAFSGDDSLIDYTRGVTMQNRASSAVKVLSQTPFENEVVTELVNDFGDHFWHTLRYFPRSDVFSSCVYCANDGEGERVIESLPALSLSGIAGKNGGTEGLVLHRMTSAWSRECRMKSDSFSALGMDMSWARYGVKCERWGEVGSMSNRGWYPFAAIEDKERGVVWGATLQAPCSWQAELYKEKETCSLTLGQGDYEFAHWRKTLVPEESFETFEAFFTVQKSVLAVCNALVKEADCRLTVPESEADMPVMFNEYCTTWGCPSEENITNILQALKPFPVKTFVIDSGWYKPKDVGWCNAIGDWEESAELFPHKISSIAKKIKDAGMIPGIWFEYEIAGRDSKCFHNEDWMLRRDGKVITCKNRRFLDLRKEEVQNYLYEKVIGFLKDNGFGYIKIDYNDSYGIGCDSDDGESLGEGGRQIALESLQFLDVLKENIEGIVIENCASGGSRIEPCRMEKVSMCSFSDAHECAEIPLVAANVSRVIPARQMQIWAVLREGESVSRTVYSLCAAMMGRICLSGDVLHLKKDRVDLINEGLDFYQTVKDIVRCGEIVAIDNTVEYYRAPKGRQIYLKTLGNKTLAIVHFLDCEETVQLEGTLLKCYTDLEYLAQGDAVTVHGKPFTAGAFLLQTSPR